MKKFLSVVALLLLCLLGYAQETALQEDLTLRSGKRIKPALRAVLPAYFGASALADAPLAGNTGFCFGVEALGVRFSSRNSPLEANLGLRLDGMNLGAGRRCFHLGLPLRAVYEFPGRAKLFAGVSASVRLGSNAACPAFMADAECGVSFYGYGLRFGYTLTPAWGGERAMSLGLVIGI